MANMGRVLTFTPTFVFVVVVPKRVVGCDTGVGGWRKRVVVGSASAHFRHFYAS